MGGKEIWFQGKGEKAKKKKKLWQFLSSQKEKDICYLFLSMWLSTTTYDYVHSIVLIDLSYGPTSFKLANIASL